MSCALTLTTRFYWCLLPMTCFTRVTSSCNLFPTIRCQCVIYKQLVLSMCCYSTRETVFSFARIRVTQCSFIGSNVLMTKNECIIATRFSGIITIRFSCQRYCCNLLERCRNGRKTMLFQSVRNYTIDKRVTTARNTAATRLLATAWPRISWAVETRVFDTL